MSATRSYAVDPARHRPGPLSFAAASPGTPAANIPPSSPSYHNNHYQSSPSHLERDLLYDLPPNVSPPTSPVRRANRLVSPTSPTFPPSASRPITPSGRRERSTTPSRVSQKDLEKFAELCRKWYFSQDESAGSLMTQTLTTLPPSQRASFSRIQATTRSAYHRSINLRRTAEFRAHLSATLPGASLAPIARADPWGHKAKAERFERFDRFLRTWCTMGMPGTQPFFKALCAVMRLQLVPQNLGGAGRHRIEWELDDAVFKEAAGKEFMLEAIDILKGVLGFEEHSSGRSSSLSSSPNPSTPNGLYTIHSRSQSQPLPSSTPNPPPVSQPASAKRSRSRAPSDPFLDTPINPPAASRSHSNSNASTIVASLATPEEEAYWKETALEDCEGEELRVWISPDLPDPELGKLLQLFPPFISRGAVPSFAVQSKKKRKRGRAAARDIEEGLTDEAADQEDEEDGKIRWGTGVMWRSERQRSDGWQGSWWRRIVLWFRRMIC